MKTRRSIYEIVAVVVTAVLHPVFVDVLHQRAAFIGLTLSGWLSYLGVRICREDGTLQKLGFRKEGLAGAFVAASVFGAVALVTMGIMAQARQSMVFRWQMLLLLALYPVWGTVQQLPFCWSLSLAGLDGKRCARVSRFTRAAAVMAKSSNAQLTALWVREPLPRDSDLPGELEGEQEAADEYFQERWKEIEEVASETGIGIRCETRRGHPAKNIVTFAKEADCDLIVLHRPACHQARPPESRKPWNCATKTRNVMAAKACSRL